MESVEKNFESFFKNLFFIILIVLTFSLVLGTIIAKVSYDKEQSLIEVYGENSEVVKKHEYIEPMEYVYKIHCFLCSISILAYIVYFGQRIFLFKNLKVNSKKIFHYWPILLVIMFLLWASVGCIQLLIESDAEMKIRSAKNIEDVPKELIDIANWSSRR